jgi:deoxyribodipyrimidine photo-lyase
MPPFGGFCYTLPMKLYKRSIFVFRRDLRLIDNTALNRALRESDEVIPVFCFDPRQVENNAYRGNPAVQFMLESLQDLQAQLQERGGELFYLWGEAEKELVRVVKDLHVEAVYFNADYTPFARTRDKKLIAELENIEVKGAVSHDALLTVPGEVTKDDGNPYTVYSPFAKKARLQTIDAPARLEKGIFYQGTLSGAVEQQEVFQRVLSERSETFVLRGGRKEGLKRLRLIEEMRAYKQDRDIPSLGATTMLSAHHKFGTISIRETYWKTVDAFGKMHQLVSELYWRDFFSHIAWHFPHVFKGAFRPEYDALEWNRSKKDFQRWCEGKTGFPIVDAGMRQMNETGYMHNRVRMIVASFLVKDLHVNWQWGEKYFAQKLLDYDPAVNNGNWQWAASTGCDAQPYFRIFNPWLQQKKFDPDAEYIKRWVPELKTVSVKDIHQGYKPNLFSDIEYPEPMVDHATERQETLKRFKALK